MKDILANAKWPTKPEFIISAIKRRVPEGCEVIQKGNGSIIHIHLMPRSGIAELSGIPYGRIRLMFGRKYTKAWVSADDQRPFWENRMLPYPALEMMQDLAIALTEFALGWRCAQKVQEAIGNKTRSVETPLIVTERNNPGGVRLGVRRKTT
jgi:hypothetical protein